MATFGKTNIGTTPNGRTATQIQACRFICPESGELTKISAYIRLYVVGNVKAAIYSDNVGMPDKKLAESIAVPVETTIGWVDFPLSCPLLANTYYWLCLLPDQQMLIYYDIGVENQFVGSIDGYVDFPDTFAPIFERYAWEQSIYGTYTVGAAPLSVSVNPEAASILVGESQTFTAAVQGGSPPYTISWIDNATGSTIGIGDTFIFSATTVGTFKIYAHVEDSGGQLADSNIATITVSEIITSTILGCVTDAKTGQPIIGALVELEKVG